MKSFNAFYVSVGMLLAIADLQGCVAFQTCRSSSCEGDSKIKTDVQMRLDTLADLGAPGSIRVQSLNRVVYLNGQVSGGLEKTIAENVATQTAGVANVVNSIDVSHE